MKPDDTDWELLATLQRDASPSNQALAEQVRISPPTALRRVRRLHEEGLIERQVALLDEDRIAALQGHGLTAIVEVTLDRQGAEHLEAFERRAVQDDAVRQCYRVAPGPDFVLVVRVTDMPAYQALAERLFTQDANVRNVRSFFSVKRAKFETRVPRRTQRVRAGRERRPKEACPFSEFSALNTSDFLPEQAASARP